MSTLPPITRQQNTISAFGDLCHTTNGFIQNPKEFAANFIRGILEGLTNSSSTNNKTSSLRDRLKHLVTDPVLFLLLENAEIHDLDENDKHFKEEALRTLKEAQHALEEAKKRGNAESELPEQQAFDDAVRHIWNKLDEYHVIVHGININAKKSSSTEMKQYRKSMEGTDNDGVSPIYSLVVLQQELRTLRTRHNIEQPPLEKVISKKSRPIAPPLTDEEIRAMHEQEDISYQLLESFALKTSHAITMHTIHYLFQHTDDTDQFNKILAKGGDIEKRYLKRFGDNTLKSYFYTAIYKVFFWLIRPIIFNTFHEVLKRLRDFLKSDVDLLKFAEKMIVILADYCGRVEKGRRDYLQVGREDEAGTFDRYLEGSIKLYGGKFTEKDIFKRFNHFIVQFVSSPHITFAGRRIPLISAFLDWIVHNIRKFIIGYVLKKTGIIESLLTKGTDAVHSAQLGLKTVFEKKLTEIVELLNPVHSPESKNNPSVKEDLKAKKDQIISRHLHLIIQQMSHKLLNFLDIAACNGDERKLRNIDNEVSAFVADVVHAVCGFFQIEPFSVRHVLEEAVTEIVEGSLLTLFEDQGKHTEVEPQLHNLLTILEKVYSYVPKKDRIETDFKYREDCAMIDRNLNTLIEQLSCSSVITALDTQLKNASGERQKAAKAYVEKEKRTYEKFYTELTSHMQPLLNFSDTPYQFDVNIKTAAPLRCALEETIFVIETYLRHLSMQLRSPELEGCYSDVKGDLHNIYANVILTLKELRPTLDLFAKKIKALDEDEQEATRCTNCWDWFSTLQPNSKFRESYQKLSQLKTALPKQARAQAIPVIDALIQKHQNKKRTAALLKRINKEGSVHNKLTEIKKREAELIRIEQLLSKLQRTYQRYEDIGNTRGDLNKERAKSKLEFQINNLCHKLRHYPSPIVGDYIACHLTATDRQPIPFTKEGLWRMVSDIDSLKEVYPNAHQTIADELADIQTLALRKKEIEDQFGAIDAAIAKDYEQLHAILFESATRTEKKIQQRIVQMQKVAHTEMTKASASLAGLHPHFTVKGCITIAEQTLYSKVAPIAVKYVAPQITKIARTLIDSLGTPFHYKQVMLRFAHQITVAA